MGVTALALLAALALLRGRAWAAVTLSSFTGQWQGDQVVLNWTTATELDNLGFNILRAAPPEGDFEPVNAALIPANCPGQPICLNPNYTFTDTTAAPGQPYWYRVQSVSLSNHRVTEDPLLCVAPPGMTCLPASPTPSATQPPASATQSAPDSQSPAPSGGGQGAPTLLSPPSATPGGAATQAASHTPAPTATAPPQSGAQREPTRTPPAQQAQPAQPSGAFGGGAGAGAAGGEEQAQPSATPLARIEPPRPSPTAAAPGGDALPTRFVFPTATLAPSTTAAAVAEAPGDGAPSHPAASGGGGALQPAGPPLGAAQTILYVLVLAALVSLPFLGYFFRQHGRR